MASPSLARVCTAGEPLVVLVPNQQGSLARVQGFRPYIAGAELNTAIGLARLGVQSSFACGLGADPFGDAVERAARAEGVDTTFVDHVKDGQTPVFFKQWSGLSGSTSVYYYRSASTMARGLWSTQSLMEALADGQWTWFHSTGITGVVGPDASNLLIGLLSAAKNSGATVSFDVNVRLKLADVPVWQQLAYTVAPFVDWFLAGDEEAQLLFQTDDAVKLESILAQHGFEGQGVVVKRGAKGAVASCKGETSTVDAWPVPRVVDTVGAGDGFNAGFIAGISKGWTLTESMRLGSVAGAFAVVSEGDYEGYPTWEEAMRELGNEQQVER